MILGIDPARQGDRLHAVPAETGGVGGPAGRFRRAAVPRAGIPQLKGTRRLRDEAMTFGYDRVEVVAALVNRTTLIAVGLHFLCKAAPRFVDLQPIEGWLVVIVAGVALAVDLATAALTYALSRSSVNIRAAFLHDVSDALGSVAVIVAGTLILLHDWRLVDPIATVLIAGCILWQAASEIGPVIRILMLGSSPDVETGAVLARMRAVERVAGVHRAHVWQMDERRSALDAHLVIAEGRWGEACTVKTCVKRVPAQGFEIEHATLEVGCARHAWEDPAPIGGWGDRGPAGSDHAGEGAPENPRP